ncbi:MAG: YdbH domain-containing protein [Dongiaceae bacterium]
MRRSRRLRRYATAFLLGAAMLAVAVWSALPTLVERSLLDRLREAGFADSSLDVRSVGLSEARIDDLRLGAGGEVTAGEIIAAYDLDFVDLRLTSVTLRDLRVAGRLDADGLSFGSLVGKGEAGGTFVDAALLQSMPPMSIESGRIDLATPYGPVTLPLRGEASPQPDGTIQAAIALELQSANVGARGDLALLLGTDSIGADLRIAEGTAAAADGLSIAFSGQARLDWQAAGRPRISAELALAQIAVAEGAFPSGELSVDATETEWSARIVLAGADQSSDLRADLIVADPYAMPHLEAATTLTAAADAWIWPALGLPQPRAGTAHLALRLAGPLPEGLADVSVDDPGDVLRLLAAGDVQGTADLALGDLAFPDTLTVASAAAQADIRAAVGVVTIEPRTDLHAAATIAPAFLESFRIPAALTRLLAQPLTGDVAFKEPLRLVAGEGGITAGSAFGLRLTAGSDAMLDVRFDGQAVLSDGLAVEEVDSRIQAAGTLPDMAIGDLTAAGIDLDIDAALGMADGRLSIRLMEAGTATVRHLTGPPLVGAVKELAIPLAPADAPLVTLDLRDGGVSHVAYDLTLVTIKATAPLLVGGPKPLPVGLTLPDSRWVGSWNGEDGHRGTVKLADGALAFPSLGVSAQGLQADVSLAPEKSTADLRVASIAASGKPPPIVPLALVGKADMAGGRLTFAGTIADKAKRISLSVAAEHALDAGAGRATLKMAPLVFAPGGLQPRDIAPAAGAGIEEASGRAAVGGTIRWDGGKLSSNLKLLLQDISFRSPQLDVLGLNSVVEIDSLAPFTTRRSQQLSAGLVDVGLPLSDVLAAFRIDPGLQLVIESARLSLAGGDVTLPPVALSLAQPQAELALAVDRVDIARLLELAQIEGLSATGSLGGRIPVRIDPDGLVIRDALLSASGPGTLRYAPATTPAALLGGGESVDLALQALSNFQYSDLTLTVSREAGGDTVALMQVKGRNPDFYGGHPVEFNLNVSGKLDQILNRGLAGYRIPDTIRERLDDFGE